ncbi:MAG: hypothetical protein K0B02_03710 [DPANN group archaeon]|nr:hypothetical protein [DPANN group archaeon]
MTSYITFLHIGKKKCPKCGVIGNKKKEGTLSFFECPRCNTEFTNEMILSDGDEMDLLNN